MKVRTDDKGVLFELFTNKEIELKWEELEQLEKLIKLLRAITDQGTPQSLLLRM
ncbi:hypothetical protein ES702_06251 [subsurface metagenome]